MGCDDYGDTTAGTGAQGYMKPALQLPDDDEDRLMRKTIQAVHEQNIVNGGCDTAMNGLDPARVIDLNGQPSVWMEVLGADYVRYEFQNVPNEQAMRILQDILPDVLELYLKKSKDYGGNVMSMLRLGPKATFVDLWRKIGKLKRCLWDEVPMEGEQPEEILADTVGHVLIILDERKQSGVR